MSMRLAGIYRTHDCATGEPLPVPERIEPAGRTVRVAFRNTGGGWVEDPALAEGLPPFRRDHGRRRVGDERDLGHPRLRGFIDAGFWNYQLNVSYPVFPCIALIDLAPRFVDLNGDGRPDLVVAQPAFEHPIVDNTANGFHSDTQDQPRTTSQAWIQRPEGGWVRDPSYDLPFHHAHITRGSPTWRRAGWTRRRAPS